jgi:hypothetical protein
VNLERNGFEKANQQVERWFWVSNPHFYANNEKLPNEPIFDTMSFRAFRGTFYRLRRFLNYSLCIVRYSLSLKNEPIFQNPKTSLFHQKQGKCPKIHLFAQQKLPNEPILENLRFTYFKRISF